MKFKNITVGSILYAAHLRAEFIVTGVFDGWIEIANRADLDDSSEIGAETAKLHFHVIHIAQPILFN